MWKYPRPFRHQHDMRDFVECCVQEPDVDDVVVKLGDRAGKLLEKLREILQSKFQLDAGQYGRKFSFQRIVVPLLKLLTSPAVKNSPNRRQRDNIYETIYAEKEFFPRVLACLEQIATRKTFQDSNAMAAPLDMNWTRDFVLPACDLMLSMLVKVTDGAADPSADSNIDRLSRILKDWPASKKDSRLLEDANVCINKCRTLVRNATRMQRASQARHELKLMTPELRVRHLMKSSNSTRANRSTPIEGPGMLRPSGPRHDNDKMAFRDISILPTQKELLCDVFPYLPTQSQTQQQQSPEEVLELSRLEAYLDTQFRLTREDMLEPLRDPLKSFIKDKALRKMRSNASSCRVKTCKKDSGTVQLDVFRNVKFSGISTHFKIGVCVRVEFDAPEGVASMTGSERKKYWKFLRGSKRLQHDTIVCVFNNTEGHDCLRFAVVAQRKIEDLTSYSSIWESQAGQRCCIDLRMLHTTIMPSEYANWMTSGGETILLQVRGHFFKSYNSVLQALQHQSPATLPFQSLIVGSEPEELEGSGFEAPAYLDSDITFDLSFLLKDRSADMLHDVLIHDFEALRGRLHGCSASLVLDSTQIDAFASALSTNISLIQGPPGTGKSYVGVRIVQALLQNESRLDAKSRRDSQPSPLLPILCICYTNHALDQFLEDLMKSGVSLSDVVRVGSRSKSEALQQRSLSGLLRGEFTKSERSRFFLLKKTADNLEQQIAQVRQVTNNPRSWNSIKEYIAAAHPDHYDDLLRKFSGIDDEGFEVAGDRNKLDEREWSNWLNGVDLQPCVEAVVTKQDEIDSQPNSPNAFLALQNMDDNEGDDRSDNRVPEEHRAFQIDDNEGDDRPDNQVPEAFLSGGAELDCIDRVDPASDRDLRELLSGDIHMRDMSMLEREKLVDHWQTENLEANNVEMEKLARQYETNCEDLLAIDACCSSRILANHKVVGCTTSGAANYKTVLQKLGARVVVCEEAGEVFESHLIASLSERTQQLVLIGDHLQLRPKPNSYNLSRESGLGYDLDVSLFERLVSQEQQPPQAVATLLSQRRMRPQIAEILRRTLYPKLQDAGSVHEYPHVRGTKHNLYFLDHNEPEDSGGATVSCRNKFEARMVVQLVKYFSRQGYRPEQLAVLTPYSGQLLHLRELLMNENMLLYFSEGDLAEIEGLQQDESDDDDVEGEKKVKDSDAKQPTIGCQSVKLKDCIRLATVDNFQGEEADVVIVSTVRCNAQGRTGFLKISNRVNVMLSRARHGMFLLGSKTTIRNSKTAKMFHAVIDYLESEGLVGPALQLCCSKHGHITDVSEVSHFASVRDGGCDLLCPQRLVCGHVCRRRCHPDDPDHKLAQCIEPCSNTLDCGHPCPRLCFQKCGGCKRLVSFALDCGHAAVDVVCMNRSQFRCSRPMQMQMPLCEHVNDSVPCWNAQELAALQGTVIDRDSNDVAGSALQMLLTACTSTCNKPLTCGHRCMQRCGACTRKSLNLASSSIPFTLSEALQHDQRSTHAGRCKEVCERDLVCGHRCRSRCCKQGSCPPCERKCRTRCDHSWCLRACSKSCPSCVYPCLWRCEHVGSCPLPCASPCIRLPCDRRCDLRLESCGHRCPSLCGEPCPSSAYCRECHLESRIMGPKADAVVDLIELKKLIEHDPDDSPLLVLPCGHVYTTETLDGLFELDSVYKKSDDGKQWLGTLPLRAVSERQCKARCPDCSEPIQHMRRYGRIVNALALDSSEKRFLIENQSRSSLLRNRLFKIFQVGEIRSLGDDSQKVKKFIESLISIEKQCVSSAKAAEISPTDLCLAAERRYWDSDDSVHALADCSSRDHQPAPRRNQAVCYWHKLRVEVFLATLRSLRMLQSQTSQLPSIQATADGSMNSVAALEASYAELELNHSLQNARLLSARVSMEIFAIALKLTGDGKTKIFADSKQAFTVKISEIKQYSSTDQQQNELEKIVEEFAEIERDCERRLLEERREVFRAMTLDVGSGNGGFGGHWYQCPNGHLFTIGECGGAMQISKCIECKAPVGGQQHRVIDGNSEATEFVAKMEAH